MQRFIAGVSLETSKAVEEKYEAVNRKFEIIGEAARRLSREARKQFPEIPWRIVTATRNFHIHDHDDVDLDRVRENSATRFAHVDFASGTVSGGESAA
jgi:uncharacterized protein with HEPN domain